MLTKAGNGQHSARGWQNLLVEDLRFVVGQLRSVAASGLRFAAAPTFKDKQANIGRRRAALRLLAKVLATCRADLILRKARQRLYPIHHRRLLDPVVCRRSKVVAQKGLDPPRNPFR